MEYTLKENAVDEFKISIANLDASQLKVEKNAFDAINSSDTTLNLVKDGMDRVDNLSDQINVLNGSIEKTSKNMEQVGELTNMIVGFANVIAGISTKTNMLSLNASIEAARAGEHGRGFAVVAGQVRELAAQSAKSSKEITETIKSVQDFAGEMGNNLSELSSVVDNQNKVIEQVLDLLAKILDASNVSNDVSRKMENEIAYQRNVTEEVKKVLTAIYQA